MLNDYVDYLEKNPKSLLARIYGIFTVTTKSFMPVSVIVMQNTARLRDKSRKLYEFDLKGSVEGRLVQPFSVKHALMYMYQQLSFDVRDTAILRQNNSDT